VLAFERHLQSDHAVIDSERLRLAITVEATVYRGSKVGDVIEGEEIFTPGEDELLLKVSQQNSQ